MIEISHVDKWYSASFQALKDCSTSVAKGEVVVVCGPSGSGKSTLIKCVNALESINSGDIVVDGIKVNDPKTNLPKLRARVGMVFQHFELFPHLRIIENLCLAQEKVLGRSHDEALTKGSKLLDRVGLKDHARKYPAELSGGQQQRVAIARAIVFNPPVLLMDEPLSALDKQLREDLQLEIKRLHGRLGITFIYVTHDQKEALVMSDRVAVMNEGRIAQIGSPKALYDTPANRFVASFVGEANLLEATIVGKETDGLLVLKIGDVLLRAPASSLGDANDCLCMIRPEKIRVGAPPAAEGRPVNSIRATVRETVFMGEMIRYVVEIGTGSHVTAKQQHRAETPILAPGEVATIEWAIADTRLV